MELFREHIIGWGHLCHGNSQALSKFFPIQWVGELVSVATKEPVEEMSGWSTEEVKDRSERLTGNKQGHVYRPANKTLHQDDPKEANETLTHEGDALVPRR
jgi:hypothetical protein